MKLDYGSIDHILSSLETDVEKKIEEERKRVDILVKERRNEVKKEVNSVETELVKAGLERIEEEIHMIEEGRLAKMEKTKIEAKKELLDSAFDKLRENLGRFTKTKEYGKLLRELVKISKIESPIVHCRKEDEKHLKRRKTISDLECSGGVVVEDRKRTKRADFTFEKVLSRNEAKLSTIFLEAIEK